MAHWLRNAKVPPNSASMEEARQRVFEYFRTACRSLPAVMEIYNLYDVTTISQLRSTIASEIRKNTHITNPKVTFPSSPKFHFQFFKAVFGVWYFYTTLTLECLMTRMDLIFILHKSPVTPCVRTGAFGSWKCFWILFLLLSLIITTVFYFVFLLSKFCSFYHFSHKYLLEFRKIDTAQFISTIQMHKSFFFFWLFHCYWLVGGDEY